MELDLVQNAAFTDPDDSSAWLYHWWLLAIGNRTSSIWLLLVKWTQNQIILITHTLFQATIISVWKPI